MSWAAPTRADHKRFCEREGWDCVEDARGRRGTHHFAYELVLPDGKRLRTRISHPVNRATYPRGVWSHILPDQLAVTEEVFWACVREGRLPDRGHSVPRAERLPIDLVYWLINRVGLSDEEVASMTKDEAIARLQKFWSGDG